MRQRKQLGSSNIAILLGVFNETIIPLALVGYEIVKASSYPTRARGIIVKYVIYISPQKSNSKKCDVVDKWIVKYNLTSSISFACSLTDTIYHLEKGRVL